MTATRDSLTGMPEHTDTGHATQADDDRIEVLSRALEAFTETSRRMEEAYLALRERVAELDQELQDKNRELAVTGEYLANLLESISDGVIAVDTACRITHFNRAAASILGYDSSEIIGADFEHAFERPFQWPLSSGQALLRARSGRAIAVSERNSPIAGSGTARLGWVKTFQDLSELNALREQVRQVDRLAAIGEMAASVAHEIRNPLGGIRGFTAFLLNDLPEDDHRRRLVEKIDTGARSLERVVNELLDYTRPIELSPRPVSCLEVAQAALAYLAAPDALAHITCSVPPDLHVWADPDKLRQVLLNVLMNAVQSLGPGGGEVRITAEADDAMVTLTVTDTGCGIAPEELDRIFSPFFTTKEKGTGLGLAICAKIVEGHGGAISAESRAGEGATLRIRLPRAEG